MSSLGVITQFMPVLKSRLFDFHCMSFQICYADMLNVLLIINCCILLQSFFKIYIYTKTYSLFDCFFNLCRNAFKTNLILF
jgi:hypothetical protein